MALVRTLDADLFEIATGDFAVAVGEDTVRSADVLVERAGAEGNARTASDVVLVVEVLSESTMHVDSGAKLIEYAGLPTLQCYLFLAQGERRAWLWTRPSGGTWPDRPGLCDETTGPIHLPPLAATLDCSNIYRNVSRCMRTWGKSGERATVPTTTSPAGNGRPPAR